MRCVKRTADRRNTCASACDLIYISIKSQGGAVRITADSFRGIRGGIWRIWRDMAGYGGIWRDMAGYREIHADLMRYGAPKMCSRQRPSSVKPQIGRIRASTAACRALVDSHDSRYTENFRLSRDQGSVALCGRSAERGRACLLYTSPSPRDRG